MVPAQVVDDRPGCVRAGGLERGTNDLLSGALLGLSEQPRDRCESGEVGLTRFYHGLCEVNELVAEARVILFAGAIECVRRKL